MRLGSLFDGAGTFPFAALLNGITPIWASEIEPFPVEVTAARLPEMEQLGDATKISGYTAPPCDVITFGSPCQDLSVAGKRVGLGGERSKLFLEAIRIIKEMREKTNGKQPRYAVWENVPGAFSSDKGEDFRTVLEEFCKIKDETAVIPRPPKGKWRTAGLVLADGYSIAWRVLDSQFWGIPQRRRRIFLVADFGGQCAGEVLFKQKGLSRSFAESRKSWNGITTDTTYGTYSSGGSNGHGTLGDGVVSDVIPLENHPNDSRLTVNNDGNVQTLTSRMGTGGGNTPYILIQGVGTYNQTLTGNKSKTLLAGHTDPDGVPCVAINLPQDAVPNGQISPRILTGNSNTRQANLAVCYQSFIGSLCAADVKQVNSQYVNQDKLITEIHFSSTDKNHFTLCEDKPHYYPIGMNGDITRTLDAHYGNGCGMRGGVERELVAQEIAQRWTVRRITPIECARLQGMPDWWCSDIPHRDASEYKMWGNGMALPCAMYIMQNLKMQQSTT